MAEAKSTNEPEYFSADSCPYGMTYGEWTVKWWRWFLSTPRSRNPVLDSSGKYAAVNQPSHGVWFLAGKLADENTSLPSRYCSIPSGRSILFPVISCEANPLEYPELRTEEELINHVTADENTIVEKVCLLNGRPVPVQRVKSDPPIFGVTINEDNVYNMKGGQTTIAYGEGYWVFLKPLSPGDYELSFRGSCELGRLRSGAKYKLNVQDKDMLI